MYIRIGHFTYQSYWLWVSKNDYYIFPINELIKFINLIDFYNDKIYFVFSFLLDLVCFINDIRSKFRKITIHYKKICLYQ